MGWGLVPADDDMLRFLMGRGASDAKAWAAAKGLLGPEGPSTGAIVAERVETERAAAAAAKAAAANAAAWKPN